VIEYSSCSTEFATAASEKEDKQQVVSSSNTLTHLVHSYAEGLLWTFLYYFAGIVDAY
jgi:5'-3' exonuclease